MVDEAFRHSLHRELWLWLSVNPGKSKGQWYRWKHNGGDIDEIEQDCFACQYDVIHTDNCESCPLVWKDERCYFIGSEYARWTSSQNTQERIAFALAIANLPLKHFVTAV